MNDLATRSRMPSPGYSQTDGLTIELAKMLALVAPTSMSTEQQEIWLRAAIDALEDIRADEVRSVSAEIRRSVTRPAQIVPAIAEKVAAKRASVAKSQRDQAPSQPWEPQTFQCRNVPPLTADEIEKMPGWLRETGLRIGFLKWSDGQLIDASR